MQPFLEARFTPGIVDGGERGSSKGLGPLLDELLGYVKEVGGSTKEVSGHFRMDPVSSREFVRGGGQLESRNEPQVHVVRGFPHARMALVVSKACGS